MNTTKEQRKEQAVKLLKELDIFKPYVKGFEKDDSVCFYENFGGFWAYQEPELQQKIQEVEQEHNCTVYAITHELTEFGELYDFLLVTNEKREWKTLVEKAQGNEYYAFAYCWNKDDDFCSEFGTIIVKSFGGGIKRIG
ncbi:MAG: hypothetical protein SPL13_01070 [Clostridia bacterium]|nr:hypothetical protein [Clostridia bacterium]